MIVWQQKDDGSLNLVDAATSNIVGTWGGGNVVPSVMHASLARTDTAAKTLFTLPKGAIVIGFEVFVSVASNAADSATISVGNADSATFYLNTVDVKSAVGKITLTTKVANLFAAATDDGDEQAVLGVYAEGGTASTTGGPFYVACYYVMA